MAGNIPPRTIGWNPKQHQWPMFYWVERYPAVSGFQVFKGARQSIPSSIIAS